MPSTSLPDLGLRYQAVCPVGEGGSGTVWRAEDRRVPGRSVAIKRLTAGTDSEDGLRRELVVLRRLRHPAIAAVHGLERGPSGEALLVMELVEGPTLDRWCREATRADALRVFAELLGALDFLHRRGVMHRDLKPDNVRVSPEGPKLLDFGLAARGGAPTAVGGTLGYLAPEVLEGAPPSAQSDLYALGVMLAGAFFQLSPPLDPGSDALATQLDAQGAATSDAELAGIARIARQLLARDPSLRPASAAESLRLLEELPGGSVGRTVSLLLGRGLCSPLLVGRNAELAELERCLEDLSRGAHASRLALVVGEPGSGRSRLLEEVALSAEARGLPVQVGWPSVAAPEGEASSAPDPVAERARAVARILGALEALGSTPGLLVLDDLDEALDVELVQVLLRLPDRPLLVVASTTEAARADRTLGPRGLRLALSPLPDDAVRSLVGSMLPCGVAPDPLVGEVASLAEGSPLLAAELVRLGVAAFLASGGQGPLRLPDGLERNRPQARDVAVARVRQLSEPARRTGALLALLGTAVPRRLLVELDPTLSDERLGALALEGVARRDEGDAVRLASPALGRALLDAVTAEERGALGRHTLAALRADPTLATLRAAVRVNAGLKEEAPTELLAGARAAREALDLSESLRLYREALSCHGLASPARQRGAEELAALLQALGRHGDAVAVLAQAADEVIPDERAAALCALADAQLKAGRTDEALGTLSRAEGTGISTRPAVLKAKVLLFAGRHAEAQAVAELLSESLDPAVRAEALHVVGLVHYYRGALDLALAALDGAWAAVAARPDRLAAARISNSLALVHQRRADFTRARACYQEALRRARELKHLPFEATFLMNLASVAQQLGDFASALAGYQQSLETATRFGGGREMAQVSHNLARLYALLGQEQRARQLLGRAESLAQGLAWRALQGHNRVVQAELALSRGAAEEAAAALDDAEGCFATTEEAAGVAEVALGRARVALCRGDASEAWSRARGALELCRGAEVLTLQAHLLCGSAELAREGGTPESALRELRQAQRLAEDVSDPEAQAEVQARLADAHAAAGDATSASLHRQLALQTVRAQLERLPEALRPAYRATTWRAAILASGETPQPGASDPQRPGDRTQKLDAELLAALLQVNKELNAEPDLRRLLERIMDHAVELAGAERGFLLLDQGGKLDVQVARNIDQETIRRKEFKISRSVAEEVVSRGKPVMTVDALHDDRFREFLSVHHLRLRSILCVPLVIRRAVRGAIYLDNRFQTEAFTARQRDLLSAFADQAAIAIGTWELLEENRRRQAELEQGREDLRRVNAELERALASQSERLDELAELARRQKGELEGRYQFENLVGQSAAMREVFRLIDRVKDSTAPVFIFGESGTGKELVAKALHYGGHRKAGPFVSVNCGAIPPTLLESELFGHQKGAFTGAERTTHGLFERADGGTIFLDEVGDTSAELQVKLLRVLQEKRFSRVGAEEELHSDFRLVAASNKDLGELVRQGRFREDLFYRINVIQLQLPPLRRRREDIPLLVAHLFARHGGDAARLSKAALRLLVDHDWPGNVRELENEVLRMLALGGETVLPEDLSPRLQGARSADVSAPAGGPGLEGLPLKDAIAELERQLALSALKACRGSVTEAARRLGMTRVGLHKLLRRHGLTRS
ncbi:MAG: sigma 54-interacting transcriptional regulator [Deltaproteobacteria bacterium]|nr:sigma 54-interacting transcriptional regulator [Deltaproteobacteria bacterium]